MADKKSRAYELQGDLVSFTNRAGKFIGMSVKNSNGLFKPENNTSTKFNIFKASDESLDAFNKSVYGSNKNGYQTAIESASNEEMSQYFASEDKKFANQELNSSFEGALINNNLAFSSPQGYDRYNTYGGGSSNRRRGSDIMAYPLDIDLMQDHMKITRYKYLRADINQSKSARVRADGSNIAGDSVIGKPIEGTIILPMPKPTDVNGVEWGGSDLTSTGIAALGAARGLSNIGMGGLLAGVTGGGSLAMQEQLRNAGVTAGQGNIVGLSGQQIAEQRDAARALKRGNEGNIQALGQSISADALSKLTGVLGADIDVDTFLARTGGRVLNPNAEMLFQGPVIRDFSFEYTMIARSEKEGREIRKIIRFLKLGMAPKFQNTSFLANPDIFTLEYKNGPDKRDVLKTVNLFNPGGLALTTLQTDYAPSGYWSAYRDSQPVAVKLSLAFTELRPIYHGDQDKTPTDSVGY